ncbi:hypothetical protein J2T36_000385 [Kerstersia gyiorum]|nr:hypothetical protein [Kerstersia gyiorum]
MDDDCAGEYVEKFLAIVAQQFGEGFRVVHFDGGDQG